jgi:uncharacterized protein
MRKDVVTLILVLFALLLFTFFSSPPTQAKTTFITIGTGGITGVYYPTGGAIAKIVNKKRKEYGIRCTVGSTGGSVYNINAIMAGDLEFGIAQSDRQYQAFYGSPNSEWAGKPQKNLRAVFSIYAESTTLVAAVDTGIETIRDLKGKRVNIGNPGSGQRQISIDALMAVGLDYKNDMKAEGIKVAESSGLLQDGRIDAFFYTASHPNGFIKEATSGRRKVRFVPISGTGIDQLIRKYPYYAKSYIPVSLYPNVANKYNVETFGVKATFVTSYKVPDKIVYAITKEVFDNFEDFKRLHPAYLILNKKDMLSGISAPIHPGAMKYYKEVGLTPGFQDQETYASNLDNNRTYNKYQNVPATPTKTRKDTTPPKITITSHNTRGIKIVEEIKKTTISGRAFDNSGVVEVIINNKEAYLDEKGNFSTDIFLKIGQNNVMIRAMDTFENVSTKSFTITRKSTNAPFAAKHQTNNKLSRWYTKQNALVVGIDRYRSNDIDKLENAVNDAKAVTNILKNMGFNVTELYDSEATKTAILSSFRNIQRYSKYNDSFIFYFAGHGQGITLENKEQIGYIIPYDANISLRHSDLMEYETEAIKLNEIKLYCKNMRTKHVALLLDSCFSGLAMKRSLPKTNKMDFEYYNDLLSRKAINILTAGDDQPVSDGTDHSPFTRAILNGLGKGNLDLYDRDGYATFSELAVYVKGKVEKATYRRQRPQFDNLSEDDGDFVFKFSK